VIQKLTDFKTRCPAPQSFAEHFSTYGVPLETLEQSRATLGNRKQMKPCPSCNADAACRLHACTCTACRRHGTDAMACSWRASIKEFRAYAKTKTLARRVLTFWRQKKNNNRMRRAPTFFKQCWTRGLPGMERVRLTRERAILDQLSNSYYLFDPRVIVNLSQNVHRGIIRLDGTAPTLDSNCRYLFVPAHCQYLSARHCFALHGFRPREAFNSNEVYLYEMAGNTIPVNVLGVIVAAALDEILA